MIAIMNAVQYDPAGLFYLFIGFKVAAAHHFVFQKMMYNPKNILWIDYNSVEQLMTVHYKPGREVLAFLWSTCLKEILIFLFNILNYGN